MAQQGFNPFAPQMSQQQQAQVQGVQAPATVDMTGRPGLMETIAPSVAVEAMGSRAAGDLGGFLGGTAKDAWGSLTGAGGPSAAALADAAVVTSQAPTALMGAGMGGTAGLVGADAAIASQALASGTVAASTGATVAAGAAPMALMAGPFAPLVLGGMMLAANSGK